MLKYIISDSPKKVILFASSNQIKVESMLSYFLNHGEDAYIYESSEPLHEITKKYKINQFSIIEN